MVTFIFYFINWSINTGSNPTIFLEDARLSWFGSVYALAPGCSIHTIKVLFSVVFFWTCNARENCYENCLNYYFCFFINSCFGKVFSMRLLQQSFSNLIIRWSYKKVFTFPTIITKSENPLQWQAQLHRQTLLPTPSAPPISPLLSSKNHRRFAVFVISFRRTYTKGVYRLSTANIGPCFNFIGSVDHFNFVVLLDLPFNFYFLLGFIGCFKWNHGGFCGGENRTNGRV